MFLLKKSQILWVHIQYSHVLLEDSIPSPSSSSSDSYNLSESLLYDVPLALLGGNVEIFVLFNEILQKDKW